MAEQPTTTSNQQPTTNDRREENEQSYEWPLLIKLTGQHKERQEKTRQHTKIIDACMRNRAQDREKDDKFYDMLEKYMTFILLNAIST